MQEPITGDRLVLKRHSAPTKYDHAPRGSWCRIDVGEKEYELYVQRSSEDNRPVWEKLGLFMDRMPFRKKRSL
jgi:hypothetical protein